MADLTPAGGAFTPNEPFDVELRGIDGTQLFNNDGSPMTISVLGADSDTAVKARNAQANRRIQAGPRAKLTAEGLIADGHAYLAKLSQNWNVTMGGEKPPFSYDAVLALYSNPLFAFIVEQVDAAVAERSNFLKGSATN
jgi:hypothetical protein